MNWFYTPKQAEAFSFAVVAHHGQKYGDYPYFTHIVDVLEQLHILCDPTENEIIAAALHDTVEDVEEVSLDVLSVIFGEDVADIVSLLTKDPSLSYEQNIARIIDSGNISAARVKLADNKANQQADLSGMDPERRARLTGKYDKSIAALEKHLKG